jgi:hypothetical protein
MTKSEFYKIWYTRRPEQELSEKGYPSDLTFMGDPITTEKQWQKFLESEIDLEEFVKFSEEACEILGVEYVRPYKADRIYPNIGDQLDGIYKSLLAIKNSGVDIGPEGDEYLDSITQVKEQHLNN